MGVDERALKEATIWGHMKAVVGTVVSERPADAANATASLSYFALSGKAVPPPTSTVFLDQRPKGAQMLSPQIGDDVAWALNFARQVVPPKPPKKDDEEEEAAPEEDKGDLADIVAEQDVFRGFGEGLSEEESYRVWVALKRLLDKEPLAKARFWGKIIGTKRDYFIAETKIDENRVPEKDVTEEDQPEQTGKPPETIYQGLNTHKAREAPRVLAEDAKGVNEFKYYAATSDDLTEWVQLPDVLPAHIVTARHLTAPFTGFLDARLACHPPFPGSERHYLRAQIARISHATLIAPKDMFTTDKVEDEEDEDGNPKPKKYEVAAYDEIPPMNPQEAPDASDAEAVAPIKAWFFGYKNEELLEAANWVHIAPQLLAEGRATKFKSEEEPPAEEEGDDEPPAAPVEWINPFLGDIAHDKALDFASHSKQGLSAWALRKGFSNPSQATRSYLARSLVWPGAITYAVCEAEKPGATFQSLYVGRGLKSRQAASFGAFAPPLPPLPSTEFPVVGVRLMKDCTVDDELEFEPAPPPPKVEGEEGEEGAGEDE